MSRKKTKQTRPIVIVHYSCSVDRRAQLQKMLTDLGYQISYFGTPTATNFHRAIRMYHPNIIIMDVMPIGGVPSFGEVEQIKQAGFGEIPRLFLTQVTNEILLAEARALGTVIVQSRHAYDNGATVTEQIQTFINSILAAKKQ